MNFTVELVIYLLGLAASAGAIIARISALEKKVEKLGSLAERTLRLEDWRDETERRMSAAAFGGERDFISRSYSARDIPN